MCTHMYLLCMCVRCVSAHVHAALLCLEGTVYALTFAELNFRSSRVFGVLPFLLPRLQRRNKALCNFSWGETFTDGC